MSSENNLPPADFIAAFYLLNWLAIFACPKMFARLPTAPSQAFLLRLTRQYLAHAQNAPPQLRWRHGTIFQADGERRARLAEKLISLLSQWFGDELPWELTECARAMLETEGHEAPSGGWNQLKEPSCPLETCLCWEWPLEAGVSPRGLIQDLPVCEEQPVSARPLDEALLSTVSHLSPASLVIERARGKLFVESHPALRQVMAASALGGLLMNSSGGGEKSSLGWLILDRPELHLGDDVLIPALAGFRGERAPMPSDDPRLILAPDWVCELVGPGSDVSLRVGKMMAYSREGVKHVWLLDAHERTIEVMKRGEEGEWLLTRVIAASMGDVRARIEPFEAVEMDLGVLWGSG